MQLQLSKSFRKSDCAASCRINNSTQISAFFPAKWLKLKRNCLTFKVSVSVRSVCAANRSPSGLNKLSVCVILKYRCIRSRIPLKEKCDRCRSSELLRWIRAITRIWRCVWRGGRGSQVLLLSVHRGDEDYTRESVVLELVEKKNTQPMYRHVQFERKIQWR